MNFRRYIIRFTLFAVLLSGMTVAVNYVIDPFLVFGSKRIDGISAIKADINDHTAFMKSYHPLHDQWDALILGNSRVEMGFDPKHRCFGELGMQVYNLGVPGAKIDEVTEFAANVIYQQDISEIFLSIDYADFLIRLDRSDAAATATPLTSTNFRFGIDGNINPDFRWRALRERYQALFSLGALTSSAQTVILQSPASPDRDRHGFNPANDFRRSAEVEGPGALFAQKLTTLEDKFSRAWSMRTENGELSPAFDDLDVLLDLAREHDIRVTIIVSPFHESYWNVLRRHGLIEKRKAWRDILVTRLQRHRDLVSLWDFSSGLEFDTEGVPDHGVLTRPLTWYWEPVHFRRELGDLMIDTVLADRCDSGQVRFGERVL